MNADSSKLAFPILCLARDHSIFAIHEPSKLGHCNAHAFWRNRYYDDLLIFDARGHGFQVTAAVLPPHYTFRRKALARLFGLKLQVELTLAELGPQTLETVKRRVLEWIDQEPDFWSSGEDLEELKQGVTAAPGIPELVERLGYAS